MRRVLVSMACSALGLLAAGAGGCKEDETCGNGRQEAGESCDGSDLGGASCGSLGYASGALSCTASCRFDTSECVGLVDCGNGTVDTGEQCDGSDLAGATCTSRGLGGGTLGCDPVTCQFDVSGCEGGGLCGDGVADGNEECDGDDLRGLDCTTYDATFLGGTLECSPQCTLRTSGCYGQPDFPIGGPCATNAECDGGECQPEVGTGRRTGRPGGMCTEQCDDQGACPLAGEAGVCVSSGYRSYCYRRCDPAAPDCRDGYQCVAQGDVGYCEPHCTEDDQCVVTGACDQDSASDTYGLCVIPPEVCTGGVDEDLDGLVDCADPDCNGSAACPSGEECFNGVDDDGDGLVDCDDGECMVYGACSGALCAPPPGAELTCGTSLGGESNDASGFTRVLDRYECQAPDSASYQTIPNTLAPEYAYRLTVPSPQLVTVSVGGFQGNLEVAVVKETLGQYCDPGQACFAYGNLGTGQPESVTFAAYPTMSYYVIVDGRTFGGGGGGVSSYDIAVTCEATTIEDCGNAQDDDGDGLADCDDPECAGVPPHCGP